MLWKQINKVLGEELFPLQTVQSMAERWGMKKQAVNWRRVNHLDFPQPMDGVIAKTKGSAQVFPMYAVKEYERKHGLMKEGVDDE